MHEFNQQELADFFSTTIGTVKTNFPRLRQRALKQGYFINKRGKGDNAVYEVERTEPRIVARTELSEAFKKEYWKEDLPEEIWTECYQDEDFEVSSEGRVRNKKDSSLRKASTQGEGYKKVSLNNHNYPLHRVVLLSFDPRPDAESLQVDHINGNRSDNRLINLRFVTPKENIKYKLANRRELSKALSKALEKHSYEEILEIIKSI